MQKSKPGFKQVKWHYQKTIEIPETWDVERLGDLCKLREDGKITSELYIGLEHILSGNNTLTGKGDVSEFSSTKNEFYEGDVLYGKLRPLLNKAWLATESGQCSTDILPIVASKKILNRVLLLILSNHHFFSYAVGTSAGTKMPRTNWSAIKKFIVFLPSIPEQQKISSILLNVDNSIDLYSKYISTTKNIKQGLMQTLLTRGIGHKKFKKVKWYFGKELEIPIEWEMKNLSMMCDKKRDIVAGPFGSNLVVDDYTKEGIPIIRLQNIERNYFVNKNLKFISREKAKELDYHSYLPGDIVLAKLGDPIGKTCIIPNDFPGGIVVADVVRIRPSPKKSDKSFIQYILNSNICAKQHSREIIGTTRPRVNLDEIRDLIFPCPLIHEQQKIGTILSNVDFKIIDLESKEKALKKIKKSLTRKLLIGQIRVPPFSN